MEEEEEEVVFRAGDVTYNICFSQSILITYSKYTYTHIHIRISKNVESRKKKKERKHTLNPKSPTSPSKE